MYVSKSQLTVTAGNIRQNTAENIAIDGIEVSFVSEIINQVIYHVDAKFIYEEVYYYLTIDSTDENCLENTVRLLLESAK